MFKTRILKFLLFFSLLASNIAFAQPKNIQLEYEVTRDGKQFATVKERFTQTGKQYKIESITKGTGVYALFGTRTLSSAGEVSAEGLKPSHFELHQNDNARKTLIADFDWAKNSLTMQVKGSPRVAPLEKGTQDLASYVYQFMFVPPSKDEIKVTLTTGKKINQYVYKTAARGALLNAGGVNYKTLHLAADAVGKDKKELWLAVEQHYLPLRYKVTDENGVTLEQTLTRLNVE